MESIKAFFDLLFEEGIKLHHLDAIHEIARKNTKKVECRAFEEWYAKNIYNDDDYNP